MEEETKLDDELRCYVDGDELCIVKKDFVDLQESDAIFIPLTTVQILTLKTFKEQKSTKEFKNGKHK